MSLLFIDGFDHYDTSDILSKWDMNSGATIVSSPAGRWGSQCMRVPNRTSGVAKGAVKFINPGGDTFTVIVGANYQHSYPLTQDTNEGIFEISDNEGREQATLAINSDGSLAVYRGDYGSWTQVGSSSPVALSGEDTWFYIEWKIKIDNTSGEFEIAVNGQLIHSGEGLDTQAQTESTIGEVMLRGWSGIWQSAYFSDFYICDTAGSINNGRLGSCRIYTLWPDAAGNYSQFTPSGESNNYAAVDDPSSIDEASTYVASDVSGEFDTYSLDELIFSGETGMHGAQLNLCLRKDDAGNQKVRPVYRAGGVNYSGELIDLNASWHVERQMWETNPASGEWTQSAFNNGEFGLRMKLAGE